MKRILILAVLVILILCMVGCSQETPTVPVEVGMSEWELAEELDKAGIDSPWCAMYHHILFRDGNYFVVCKMKRLDNYKDAYIKGEDISKYIVVEEITRIRAFKPREDAYLRLEDGMDFVEVVKLLGIPAGSLSGPHARIYRIFDDDNKWVTVYFGKDDTVTSVTLRENHELIWHDDFDQEESPETDHTATIISVVVSAVIVVGSVGVLFAQYRRKEKEDIEE